MASPLPGVAPATYRGEDRRRVAGPVRAPVGRTYVVAGLAVLGLWAVVTYGLPATSEWSPEVRELIHALQVASLMVALAVGALALSRWYLTSDAPALWIGVALILYGAVRLGAVELAPWIIASEGASQLASWVRPASQMVMALLLLWAARTTPVATDVSGPRLAVVAIGSTVALTVLLQFLPGIAVFIDGAQAQVPRTYNRVNELGAMPIVYGVLGVMFTWRGHQRRRWLFAWLGLMLIAIALGDVARILAPPPIEAGLLGKEVLRLAGLLVGLTGATREILYTYRDSSTRLAKSEYTALTAQERILHGQALAEERAHEARSALAAIEGATKTLEHYRDRLPTETQTALATAISGEIQRLQRLVSVEEAIGELGAFSLAESLAPLVASERARGVDIDLQVAGDIDEVGRAGSTEQVLQTLFDNARRYAPNSALTVRAEREGRWVVLRVEDRGPGVPAAEREAIFRRGVRGDTALDVPGSGLGLYVAAQLMRDQGGQLWVDDRAGGGASFAVALPAATISDDADDPVHGLDDKGEIIDGRGFDVMRRGD